MGNKDKRNKIRYSKKRRLFRGNQHRSSNVVAEENLSNLEELQFKCSSAKKMKILSSCCSSKSSVDIVNNDFVNKNNFSANDEQSNDCYIFMNTNSLEEIITVGTRKSRFTEPIFMLKFWFSFFKLFLRQREADVVLWNFFLETYIHIDTFWKEERLIFIFFKFLLCLLNFFM